MKALSLLILFIAFKTHAYECEVTQYVVPPAKELGWESNKSLIKSFIKSQTKAFKYSLKDLNRKTIGHVVSHIKNDHMERWTSISVKSTRLLPKILRHGLQGMFTPVKGAVVQKEKDIRRFIKSNQDNLKILAQRTTNEVCNELIQLDDQLRLKAKKRILFFGPTITDIHVGGTGASYAVYMIQTIDPSYPVHEFVQYFHGNHFYDSGKMWNYLHSK
jgi:hypothetical protein